MFSGSEEDRRWALVDESEAKVTPLPALDKFTVVNVTEKRILFASGYNEDARAASTFALLDVPSGAITPVATWDPAGTNAGPPIASGSAPWMRVTASTHWSSQSSKSRPRFASASCSVSVPLRSRMPSSFASSTTHLT